MLLVDKPFLFVEGGNTRARGEERDESWEINARDE